MWLNGKDSKDHEQTEGHVFSHNSEINRSSKLSISLAAYHNSVYDGACISRNQSWSNATALGERQAEKVQGPWAVRIF